MTGTGNTKDSKCGACDAMVKASSKALLCDVCDQWHHIKCGNIKEEVYNAMKNWEINWICDGCLKIKKSKTKKEPKIEGIDLLKKMNEFMIKMEERALQEQEEKRQEKEKISETLKRMEEKLGKLENIDAYIEEKINKRMEIKEKDILGKVAKEIREEIEKFKREENVVVIGMEEGNDVEKINELLTELEVNVKTTDMIIRRLGKPKPQIKRPILIKPKNKENDLRRQMFRNAKKLKNTSKEHLKKVIITNDMTVAEREKNRKLREDLKKRREAGEENLIIRNYKIVKKTSSEENSNVFTNVQ